MGATASLIGAIHEYVASPSPSPSSSTWSEPVASGWDTPQVLAAFVAAAAAVGVGLYSGWLQRRSSREAVAASNRAADASSRSATSAEKSALAAAESVIVNRESVHWTDERARAEAFAKRYQDAALQLGHASPAVRLAGVYAMARLADDWLNQRQVCIDVLTAYLRIPAPETDAAESSGERQIRRVITLVMRQHLTGDAKKSWREQNFDFTDATLSDFVLEDCVFEGTASFDGVRFEGDCAIRRTIFRAAAKFDLVTVNGFLMVEDLSQTSARWLRCNDWTVRNGGVLKVRTPNIDPEDGNSCMTFNGLRSEGLVEIELIYSECKQAPVVVENMLVCGGRLSVTQPLSLSKKPLHPGRLFLRRLDYTEESKLHISQSLIDNKRVEVGFAKRVDRRPTGATVDFNVPYDD